MLNGSLIFLEKDPVDLTFPLEGYKLTCPESQSWVPCGSSERCVASRLRNTIQNPGFPTVFDPNPSSLPHPLCKAQNLSVSVSPELTFLLLHEWGKGQNKSLDCAENGWVS